MAQKVVTMEIKYAAMFASVQAGQESVTGLCQRLGISRKTYYKYRARFLAEGWRGWSRGRGGRGRARTRHSPAMVELIVTTRAVLAVEGWDNGALSIRNRLLREGHRAAGVADDPPGAGPGRAGEPEPKKRPRSSYAAVRVPGPG